MEAALEAAPARGPGRRPARGDPEGKLWQGDSGDICTKDPATSAPRTPEGDARGGHPVPWGIRRLSPLGRGPCSPPRRRPRGDATARRTLRPSVSSSGESSPKEALGPGPGTATSDRCSEEKPRRVTPGGESPPRSFQRLLQRRPPNGAAERCIRFGGVPASCSASSRQTSSLQRRGRAGSSSNRDPVQSGCRHHGCDVARVESRQMSAADAPRLAAPKSRGARWTLLLAVGGGGLRRDASARAPRRDSATRPPSPPLSGVSSRAGARPSLPLGRPRSCYQARRLHLCIRAGLDGAPSATAARVASRGTDGSVPRFTSKQRSLWERRPTLRDRRCFTVRVTDLRVPACRHDSTCSPLHVGQRGRGGV